MRGVNKVILIGRLGKDPEARHTASGQQVTNFRIAVTEGSKDKEYTEWVNIVTWGKLAEICSQYLKKGMPVYIEGALRTRKYDDKDGVTRWVTDVNAFNMQMLSGKQDTQESDESKDDTFWNKEESTDDDVPF